MLLGASLVLSAGLVAGAFNPAPHSGGDNAGYVALAHTLVSQHAYVDAYDPLGAPHVKYPPIFPALMALLISAGASTWVAFKLLVAVLTVASVGVTCLWAAGRLGSWGGFAVAVLVAASAATVDYSHWILSDPLFVLLTMTTLWVLERGARAGGSTPDPRLLAAGIAAALAAYFTRTAGLPLLIAVLGWLALERRWRTLGAAAAVFALPALLWALRGGGGGGGPGDYASEFWLVDPYRPALGTIGPLGLVGRAAGNAGAYLTRHGPATILGPEAGALAAPLGVLLAAAALTGWVLRLRRGRPGPAELFLPLYTGLILVWPEIWGGDRFVLPLLPLVLLYAAMAIGALPRVLTAPVGGIAAALLLVPALGEWLDASGDASACAAVVEAEGPYGCYGPRVTEFVDAAVWMGAALPEGSAVMSRKPRIFYVMSGIPSRTFPFDPDPDVQLAEADLVGARYVLFDRWQAQAGQYLAPAIAARPGAFCFVRAFGSGPGSGTQLLGILPPELRREGAAPDGQGVMIGRCPEGYVAREPTAADHVSADSPRIPLLSSNEP